MRTASKLVLTAILPLSLCAQAADTGKFKITTLSSRPDMISGGDVVVRVDFPAGAAPDKVLVRLNGQDVSPALHAAPGGHARVGLITALRLGANKLEVFNGSDSKPVAEAALKDYPITGPIFSGPQEHPFVCQTQEFAMPDKSKLGAPIDENCSIKTTVTYVYKSTDPLPQSANTGRGAARGPNLKPLTNMTSLPSDVAYTTTTTGEKVPFIVRVETGTINRGIYQFAVLSDPTKESTPGPFSPPKEWNRRLIYSFGGGCPGGWFRQGNTIGMTNGVINEDVVGKGYAEASSTLNVFVNNCNEVLAAETAMMVKERFIKAYGPPDFTFSRGSSGGAEQQIPIADLYPGIVDGIIPSATFPDVLSNLYNSYDTQLLNNYFTKAGDNYSEDQELAVVGTGKYRDATADIRRVDPTKNCPAALSDAQKYDPAKNRSGARCDVFDHDVNIYGRDPATGFARRAIDNVGVQYGLAALNAKKITPAQFIDLNQKIGGYDNDGQPGAARTIADSTALRIAYETGRVTNGNLGLGKLPIIDARTYGDLAPNGNVHQKYHSLSLRDRLQKANGTFANDVLLVVGSNTAAAQMGDYAITQMDAWLTKLKKDTSDAPMIRKIMAARPADLVDSCWTDSGERIKEPQTFAGGKCNTLYPTHASPRMIAGESIANDILKCQLKAADRKDYQVQFSDAEWGRLKSVFPAGVCDWSRPGIGQRAPTGTWISYSEPPGRNG